MTEVARFDGCEVVERLHSGPLSEVYRAVQRPLGRSVLIKAIGASILPSSPFAASLEREARLLAELDHPNIVKLHDFVRRDERMWMVLEHVDGWTLEELLKKIERPGPNGSKTAGRLDQGVAVSIALEVARALAHAHERGISHRDIRPRNIVIARSGNVKTLEGAPLATTLIALMEFPSADAAQAFISDPDYTPLVMSRRSGSNSRFQLIDDTDLAGTIPYLRKS